MARAESTRNERTGFPTTNSKSMLSLSLQLRRCCLHCYKLFHCNSVVYYNYIQSCFIYLIFNIGCLAICMFCAGIVLIPCIRKCPHALCACADDGDMTEICFVTLLWVSLYCQLLQCSVCYTVFTALCRINVPVILFWWTREC